MPRRQYRHVCSDGEVSRSYLSGTRLVSMLMANGSSSNVMEILPLYVLEMPDLTVISPGSRRVAMLMSDGCSSVARENTTRLYS